MGVGWIDNIYNNSSSIWYIQSVDDQHNGALSGDSSSFKLDDGEFHPLQPGTHYAADWCGIPWYYAGKHFKVISQDRSGKVQFFTSELEGGNWIIYQEMDNGHRIARQAVPKGSDFHCNLRFEPEGIFIDVVNNNAFSGENALYQVMTETKDWIRALAPVIAEAIKAKASRSQ